MDSRQPTWLAVTSLLVSALLGACTTAGVTDDELTASPEAVATETLEYAYPPPIVCSNTVEALLERPGEDGPWLVVRFDGLTQKVLAGSEGPFSFDLADPEGSGLEAYILNQSSAPYCTDVASEVTGERWPAVAGTVTVEVLEVLQETACFNPSIEAMITLEGMRFRDDDGRVLATPDVRTDRGNFATDGQDCEEEPES